MRFLLKSMEVLRRRQKTQNQCYENDNYDRAIRDEIMKSAGCRPSYWASNLSIPICTTHESFKNLVSEHVDQAVRPNRTKQYIDPCVDIEKLQIDYVEEDIQIGSWNYKREHNEDDEWFMIEFLILTNKFKEIKQIRKYSVQSLVGNLGGYIGLCLGYALLNLPAVIMGIWKQMKQDEQPQD